MQHAFSRIAHREHAVIVAAFNVSLFKAQGCELEARESEEGDAIYAVKPAAGGPATLRIVQRGRDDWFVYDERSRCIAVGTLRDVLSIAIPPR